MLLYNLAISFYHLGIWLASFFNKKAKQWIKGRRNIFLKLKSQGFQNQEVIWFHCASLGEFEQGRPLIERIKTTSPQFKILITFFSPSGYEIRKDYKQADFICYLPIDSKNNAASFLKIVKPKMVFFVKYEFWFHYLDQLNQQNIPTYLISSIFRKDQIFFQSYGSFFKKMLLFFDHIFVQNEHSKKILIENGISKVSVAGDTRVDRVEEIKNNKRSIDLISSFKGTAKLMIGGSTWPPDEDILVRWIHEQKGNYQWKFIIAPHDIKESHIVEIESKLQGNSIRFSKANSIYIAAAQVLIIDNIGMLSSLYQYGEIALIGGGFGSGIHNTLEPIVFGLPVIFGPKYQKFEEAIQLVKTGGGFSVTNYNDFKKVMHPLENEEFYRQASSKAYEYIQLHQGATETIFHAIFKS